MARAQVVLGAKLCILPLSHQWWLGTTPLADSDCQEGCTGRNALAHIHGRGQLTAQDGTAGAMTMRAKTT